jgi:hypothetical protein
MQNEFPVTGEQRQVPPLAVQLALSVQETREEVTEMQVLLVAHVSPPAQEVESVQAPPAT